MHNELTFKEFVIRRHPEQRGHHYVTVTDATGRDLTLEREGKPIMEEVAREYGLSPNGILLYESSGKKLNTHHYCDALLDHRYGLSPKVRWVAWDGTRPIVTRTGTRTRNADTGVTFEPPRKPRRGIVGGRR